MPKLRLYEVPNKTKIRLLEEKDENGKCKEVLFHHLDGAYSYCIDEENNVVVNIPTWAWVEIVK